ncbi:MAG: hypothetical protein K9J84_10650 [Bacteroidia bacterium]|nr:hypothetical protein [Bacteroidia bacterium]
MTTSAKILAIQVLPTLADFLEDIPMSQVSKMKRNLVINSIRSFDSHMIDSADKEEMEQQIKIQQSFRKWCEENFEEDGSK